MSELISTFSHFAVFISIWSPLSFCTLLFPTQLFLPATSLLPIETSLQACSPTCSCAKDYHQKLYVLTKNGVDVCFNQSIHSSSCFGAAVTCSSTSGVIDLSIHSTRTAFWGNLYQNLTTTDPTRGAKLKSLYKVAESCSYSLDKKQSWTCEKHFVFSSSVCTKRADWSENTFHDRIIEKQGFWSVWFGGMRSSCHWPLSSWTCRWELTGGWGYCAGPTQIEPERIIFHWLWQCVVLNRVVVNSTLHKSIYFGTRIGGRDRQKDGREISVRVWPIYLVVYTLWLPQHGSDTGNTASNFFKDFLIIVWCLWIMIMRLRVWYLSGGT